MPTSREYEPRSRNYVLIVTKPAQKYVTPFSYFIRYVLKGKFSTEKYVKSG